jgi:hypothetical protein
MRFKLPALAAAAACICFSAEALPLQGYVTTLGGRAHVQKEADGIYVYFSRPTSMAGIVPFDEKSTFPDVYQLDGRDVEITGVPDAQGLITLTDPDQIRVVE